MKGNNMNIILCYNCGKNDHTLKDCRKKRKGNLGNFQFKFKLLQHVLFVVLQDIQQENVQKMKKGYIHKEEVVINVDL